LIQVHKASTQNQNLRSKTSKISMSQRDNRKSCHSDQLSLRKIRFLDANTWRRLAPSLWVMEH
jgi:hypothetical protein